MENKFKYYGGKRITDPKILKEIKVLKEIKESGTKEIINHDDIRKMYSGDIKCSFPDGSNTIIRLTDNVGNPGGEGCVFKTNIDGLVAKIYYPSMQATYREEKIKLMVNNQIDDKRICWPKGVLTYSDKFIGFVMPYVNKEYDKIYLDDKEDIINFLKNDKRNALRLLINVMNVFEKLRAYNIVYGDVHYDNIMINRNNYEVILIDVDGAQIDKYPCIACKENFNAPELLKSFEKINEADWYAGKVELGDYAEEKAVSPYYNSVYSTFLRDNYSLAYYVFTTFIVGFPYCNIFRQAKCLFTYDIIEESKSIENGGDNTYSARWAHLPMFMRESLYKCFTTKNPNERLTPSQWKKRLEYYLKLLDEGRLNHLDNDCMKIIDIKSLDYHTLQDIKFALKINIISSAFTMNDAIKKISSNMKKNGIMYDIDIPMISEYLKHNRMLKIDKCTIKLLFNIGILKKVSLEYIES